MTTSRFVAALLLFTVAAVLSAGFAQGEGVRAETSYLATDSYSLHPVDDSGVWGQLQIVEQETGGTLLILSLMGMEEGRTYPAALYVGNCGPDRPVHLELERVGRENDRYVGITESEFSFADLTQGNFFVFVFDGDTIDRPESEGLDVPALACGEVGLGAGYGQP